MSSCLLELVCSLSVLCLLFSLISYLLVGNKEITCGDRGWMDRPPVCEGWWSLFSLIMWLFVWILLIVCCFVVLKCSPPGDITNGSYTPAKEEYSFSDVVTYQCSGDLVLNGSKQLKCSENEQFQPGLPKCICECFSISNDYYYFIFLTMHCDLFVWSYFQRWNVKTLSLKMLSL